MNCINADEFIKKFKKELSKTRVYCPKCKKWIKFKILKEQDYYYYECPKHKEVDLNIENDILEM